MAKVTTKITVKGEPETDIYSRRFGKALDVDLKRNFWNVQPEIIMKNPDGTDLITKNAFTHDETLELEEGIHTIQVAQSYGSSDYTWKFEVLVNDVSLGTKTGVYDANPFTATFEVVKPPKTLAETMSEMMGTMMSLIMVVMLISMLSSLMKAFKKK
jgi:hypothetical protein